MRHNYQNQRQKAIIKGSRNGSGKLVFEFDEKFLEIWGRSPNVSKLKFGTSTRMLLGQEHQGDGDFNNISSNSSVGIDDSSKTDENVPQTESQEDFDENLDDDGNDYDPSVSDDIYNKPPAPKKNNWIMFHDFQIIKGSTLKEKKLSSAQREQILINDAKEDAQFKKDLAPATQDWNRGFIESIKMICQSLTDTGAAICRSIEVMSQSLQSAANSNMQDQNLFYKQDCQQFIPGPFTHAKQTFSRATIELICLSSLTLLHFHFPKKQ